MKPIFFSILITLFTLSAFSQTTPIRAGKHALTLQWIAFNDVPPGEVTIKPLGKGKYEIHGTQDDESRYEFVKIDGTFTAKGRKLYFDGTILSMASSVNNGKICTRTGPQVFWASGVRKYWRLQQMLNCDGITTDYIDIFF